MSLPRENYKEGLFYSTVKMESSPLSERSKSREHTDRFITGEEAQKTKKIEDNQS